MLRPGETREWVDEGQLSKERTQSKVAEVLRSMIRATGELDCSNAYIRLREPGKSKDKAEQWIVGHGLSSAMVPQRRDFRGVINPILSWRESIGRERD
ncbi:hypothetical protein B296_00041474 [Ensete ventricosum]|uniref:Uncharacterized protein n=1 Tax=Ensete ventricosum TaxID=4639 RepID=A0A426ZLW2_ENSVE|nr:hypothetical protein B296_00041474 [Ensete ventricosum]